MSTLEQPELKTPAPPARGGSRGRRRPSLSRPPRRFAWRRHRLSLSLTAPALVFMVLVHILPMVGGLVLSFKKLNTFTFSQLFNAPWNGLQNYRSILFESENPHHSGVSQAVVNTVEYTILLVACTLCGALAIAVLLNRQMRGIKL